MRCAVFALLFADVYSNLAIINDFMILPPADPDIRQHHAGAIFRRSRSGYPDMRYFRRQSGETGKFKPVFFPAVVDNDLRELAQEIDADEQRRTPAQVPEIEDLQIGYDQTIVSEREVAKLHALDACDPACDDPAGDAAQQRRLRTIVGGAALQQRIQQCRVTYGNLRTGINECRSID